MAPHQVSREDLLALWERRKAGERTEELAAEVGIQTVTLQSNWRKRLKVSINKKRQWTPEEVDSSYARLLAGESSSDIAEDYRVSTNALRILWRRRLGILMQNHRSWTREEAQDTWERRQRGESSEALARELGVTKGALLRAWKRILGETLDKGKNHREWTFREIRESWVLRQRGIRTEKIAARYEGVTTNSLRAAWKRHGFTESMPKTNVILTEKLVQEAWLRRLQGETGAKIAEDYGVRPTTLYTAWRKRGLKAQREYARKVVIDSYSLWSMRNQHKSWNEICRAIDLPQTAVSRNRLAKRLRRYCKRIGIQIPNVPRSVR